MPKPPKFEGGGLSEGEGRFRTTEEQRVQKEFENIGEDLSSEGLTLSQAEEIMGEDIIGPKEILHVFGDIPHPVPLITFTKGELQEARHRGQILVLFTDKLALSTNESPTAPITLRTLCENFPARLGVRIEKGEIQHAHAGQEYFEHEVVRPGWVLVDDPTIGKKDEELLRSKHLFESIEKGTQSRLLPVPPSYLEAFKAFEKFLQSRVPISYREYCDQPFIQLTAPTAVEMAYLKVLYTCLDLWNIGALPVGESKYTRSLTDGQRYVIDQVNPLLTTIDNSRTRPPSLNDFLLFQRSGRDESDEGK